MDLNQYFHFTSNLSFSLSSQLRPYWCSVAAVGWMWLLISLSSLSIPSWLLASAQSSCRAEVGKKQVLTRCWIAAFPSWTAFVGFKMFFLMYFQYWVSVWTLIMVPDFPLQDLIPSFSDDVTSLSWALLKLLHLNIHAAPPSETCLS